MKFQIIPLAISLLSQTIAHLILLPFVSTTEHGVNNAITKTNPITTIKNVQSSIRSNLRRRKTQQRQEEAYNKEEQNDSNKRLVKGNNNGHSGNDDPVRTSRERRRTDQDERNSRQGAFGLEQLDDGNANEDEKGKNADNLNLSEDVIDYLCNYRQLDWSHCDSTASTKSSVRTPDDATDESGTNEISGVITTASNNLDLAAPLPPTILEASTPSKSNSNLVITTASNNLDLAAPLPPTILEASTPSKSNDNLGMDHNVTDYICNYLQLPWTYCDTWSSSTLEASASTRSVNPSEIDDDVADYICNYLHLPWSQCEASVRSAASNNDGDDSGAASISGIVTTVRNNDDLDLAPSLPPTIESLIPATPTDSGMDDNVTDYICNYLQLPWSYCDTWSSSSTLRASTPSSTTSVNPSEIDDDNVIDYICNYLHLPWSHCKAWSLSAPTILAASEAPPVDAILPTVRSQVQDSDDLIRSFFCTEFGFSLPSYCDDDDSIETSNRVSNDPSLSGMTGQNIFRFYCHELQLPLPYCENVGEKADYDLSVVDHTPPPPSHSKSPMSWTKQSSHLIAHSSSTGTITSSTEPTPEPSVHIVTKTSEEEVILDSSLRKYFCNELHVTLYCDDDGVVDVDVDGKDSNNKILTSSTPPTPTPSGSPSLMPSEDKTVENLVDFLCYGLQMSLPYCNHEVGAESKKATATAVPTAGLTTTATIEPVRVYLCNELGLTDYCDDSNHGNVTDPP